MKSFLSLCIGIIFSGAAYSLYNAAHDYGLATVSLPPAIIAQQDDSGTKNPEVLIGYELRSRDTLIITRSDSIGNLDLGHKVVHNMIPDTEFRCRLWIRYCHEKPNSTNRCDKSKEGIFILSLKSSDKSKATPAIAHIIDRT